MVRRIPIRPPSLHFLHLHINRNREMSYAAPCQSSADSKVGDALYMSAIHHTLIEDGDIYEEFVESNILLGQCANQITVLQPGNRQHRRSIQLSRSEEHTSELQSLRH